MSDWTFIFFFLPSDVRVAHRISITSPATDGRTRLNGVTLLYQVLWQRLYRILMAKSCGKCERRQKNGSALPDTPHLSSFGGASCCTSAHLLVRQTGRSHFITSSCSFFFLFFFFPKPRQRGRGRRSRARLERKKKRQAFPRLPVNICNSVQLYTDLIDVSIAATN